MFKSVGLGGKDSTLSEFTLICLTFWSPHTCERAAPDGGLLAAGPGSNYFRAQKHPEQDAGRENLLGGSRETWAQMCVNLRKVRRLQTSASLCRMGMGTCLMMTNS